MTLETVIMQAGINPKLVYVCVDEKFDEISDLVHLFGFNFIEIDSSKSYTEIMHKSLKKLLDSDEILSIVCLLLFFYLY